MLSKLKLAYPIARLVIALPILVACGDSNTSANPNVSTPLELKLPSNYALRWSDEFDMPNPLSSAWTYDVGAPLLGGTVWGNSENQYYTDQAKNAFLDSNGALVIQPVAGLTASDMGRGDNASTLDSFSTIQARNVSVTSARLTTNTSSYYAALNATPYGFYEIRAKVPCVRGAWPAIWMMGKNGDWPARGEVDIMEWFGNLFADQPNQLQSGIHTTQNHWGSAAGLLFAKRNLANFCTEFHKFQLHWSADELLIGVDGLSILSYKKPNNATAANWPFSQPAYLLLNVAVGGNLGGAFNLNDLGSMAMKIDYVKVWQPPS